MLGTTHHTAYSSFLNAIVGGGRGTFSPPAAVLATSCAGGHQKHRLAPWEALHRGAMMPSLLGCNSCPWLRARQTQKGGQCPTVPEMLCLKLTSLVKHLESSSKSAAWKALCKPSCSVLNPRPGDSCTLSFLSCAHEFCIHLKC